MYYIGIDLGGTNIAAGIKIGATGNREYARALGKYANAEAAANMGLETHIVRTYDGVGLHNGKDPCKWCMDRAGDWTDYQSAYDAGCFERHPGCGCRIDYHVGKTRTWSNRAGTWR